MRRFTAAGPRRSGWSARPSRRPALAIALALGAGALGFGCLELPRSFERVDLERAQRLLGSPEVSVVDAVEVGRPDPGRVPGGIRWRVARDGSIGKLDGTAEVADGAVLVIASNDRVGSRSAAALARAGNRPVFLFIPASTEERAHLLGAVLAHKEIARGEGS